MAPPTAFEHAVDGVTGAEQVPAQVHLDGAVEHLEREAHRVAVAPDVAR